MSEFVSYLHEIFEPLGPISSRKMFGGHGIYYDGIMIGLVADDELYLKVDAESRPVFEQHDLPAFEFTAKGKTNKMSYHLAPESIFDDPDEALRWGRLAHDAALRAKKKK
ncbi:MAG: TfoX/Sxy family protein [Pseudomonadota bacterium]